MSISAQEPAEIGLVCFGAIPAKIERMVKAINKYHDVFRIVLFRDKIDLPPKYDLPHCFSNEYYFELLRSKRSEKKLDFIIGLTNEALEEGKFNTHDHMNGLGLVTTHDFHKYKPPTMSVNRYAAYLILCECFCIVGKQHFEHDNRLWDLFDECHDKDDLTRCLENPIIHAETRKKLTSAGFPVDSGEKILRYTARRGLGGIVNGLVRDPLLAPTALILGIFHLLIIEAHLPVRIAVTIVLVGFVPTLRGFQWLIRRRAQAA